jgi:APA family basic amino acid/polyamine antiporter
VANSLFRTKPIDLLLADCAATGEHTLRRTLGPISLISLGIGAIIGAGLFVRTAAAIADRAGPSVTIAFIVAAVGCALAGLCYAEFASMIPVAGSAYTYSYATMGEFVAWIIGWDLVLEYAVGAATVAIAWSEYFNRVLGYFGLDIPYQWRHSPFESMDGVQGIMNIPAVFILALLSALLIRGTRESALVNNLIVIIKVSIVLMVIGFGWSYINPANHTPMIPAATTYVTPEGVIHNYGGLLGILGAAGVVFFAFIGFDAVSTTAQETKNPAKDMPIGILGSLAVCTILYVLFSYVLSGVATVEDFRTTGREASVAFVITKYMTGFEWLSRFVTFAILAGFSSVILVMLLGQSRVFYAMSLDGLVPPIFSAVHPRFRTPYKSNMLFFVLTALFGAFIPGDIVGEMTSIGTLFAFMLVCAGVWILRKRRPDLERGFTVPALPVVATLGILVCGAMIYGLGWTNWLRLLAWLALGLVLYFGYARHHSRLATPARTGAVR